LAQICSNGLSLQQTTWLASNPYNWADPSLGVNSLVAADADVLDIQISFCGSAISLDDPESPTNFSLNLPQQPATPAGYFSQPACVIWDGSMSAWSLAGVTAETGASNQLECSAAIAGGAYTAIYNFIPLPTTTQTTQSATSTTTLSSTTMSTTTMSMTATSWTQTTTASTLMRGLNDTEDADETDETTTAGPYCDSLTMPTPATASAFTCYGPLGIGQECRAQCEDLNNSEAVIRCESDLLWAELERCPGLETTESDSDNTDETVIIVGIVGGSVGGFVMLGLAVMYMRSKSKSKAVADLAEIQTVQEKAEIPPPAREAWEPPKVFSETLDVPALDHDAEFWEWVNEWTQSRKTMEPLTSIPDRTRPKRGPTSKTLEPATSSATSLAHQDRRQIQSDSGFWEWAQGWVMQRRQGRPMTELESPSHVGSLSPTFQLPEMPAPAAGLTAQCLPSLPPLEPIQDAPKDDSFH